MLTLNLDHDHRMPVDKLVAELCAAAERTKFMCTVTIKNDKNHVLVMAAPGNSVRELLDRVEERMKEPRSHAAPRIACISQR